MGEERGQPLPAARKQRPPRQRAVRHLQRLHRDRLRGRGRSRAVVDPPPGIRRLCELADLLAVRSPPSRGQSLPAARPSLRAMKSSYAAPTGPPTGSSTARPDGPPPSPASAAGWTAPGPQPPMRRWPRQIRKPPGVSVTGTNRTVYVALLGAFGFTPIDGQTTASPALTAYSTSTGVTLAWFVRGTGSL